MTLDRDPRWVGSPSEREFSSAFLRFLLCLGVAPVVCPPHHPWQNGVVERYHRNVKYECLLIHSHDTRRVCAQLGIEKECSVEWFVIIRNAPPVRRRKHKSRLVVMQLPLLPDGTQA